MLISPTNDLFESSNCSMLPFWKSGLNMFCIDNNEAKNAENIMIGATIFNKKSLSESLISGNNNAIKKNKIMPVSTSVQRLNATFVSRENNRI